MTSPAHCASIPRPKTCDDLRVWYVQFDDVRLCGQSQVPGNPKIPVQVWRGNASMQHPPHRLLAAPGSRGSTKVRALQSVASPCGCKPHREPRWLRSTGSYLAAIWQSSNACPETTACDIYIAWLESLESVNCRYLPRTNTSRFEQRHSNLIAKALSFIGCLSWFWTPISWLRHCCAVAAASVPR